MKKKDMQAEIEVWRDEAKRWMETAIGLHEEKVRLEKRFAHVVKAVEDMQEGIEDGNCQD